MLAKVGATATSTCSLCFVRKRRSPLPRSNSCDVVLGSGSRTIYIVRAAGAAIIPFSRMSGRRTCGRKRKSQDLTC